MTLGELYDMHKDLSVLEENVKAGKVDGLSKAAEAIGPTEAGKAAEGGKEADSPREEEEDGGSIVQKAEPASKYKEKAYESLIDTKKKAENLLAALEMDTSFAL